MLVDHFQTDFEKLVSAIASEVVFHLEKKKIKYELGVKDDIIIWMT